ncbi:hypothetical protein CBE01nite_33080 [Clostridium beijerinckii]|uniref:CDP-glycerol glycerophosphotransferase family protein n=1 Tax=Clostridium beijerinckii TaxID=1520 RepID=A0AB74VJK6_CLOBE|nr:CDP-glycerol glycerophosphotransferase family protein [Clostridium beijerinckii]NRZ25602.1 CDP-glycerol glycerophosphotransferase (TagB/SpsB family) [Clostridium beijerinckii]NYB98117.1 CDP-glycerol glycerophosphotransferase (TagB/SpsB family) [Clostridium beijerinckii]OOM23268.1 putative CDP-glycerol:glycerophosphate glycerophosphotransferase [Clostridium beijerinckii]QUN36354.1 CDP-glycerol glycerophosphotransferase family protein [Clostridium beijerinckii]SQB12936.1 CDP-glycerol:poly(gly
MKLFHYIKDKGIKRMVQVLYEYKIQIAFTKLCSIFTKNKALKNIIIIESHNDFDCNGGAFYNYLIDNGFNRDYKIIWLLKHDKPDRLPQNVECFFLHKPSLKKAYYICMAKYLLSDNTITDKVRSDQKSFYFTHGAISLKETQGLCDIPSSVDYVLSPSKNYDSILSRELSMSYPNDRMIHMGYPSEDVYFKNITDEFSKITDGKYNKKILWMPTFRKGGGYKRVDSDAELPFGIPMIDSVEMFEKLDRILNKFGVILVIKIHPMQDLETIANLSETPNIKILTGITVKELMIDNYRLMANVDALISDYSASAFSYLLMNRPIGFVLSDLKDYKLGLCVDNVEDYLVGDKIFTFNDMIKFIENVASNNDVFKDRRSKLIKWLYKYQDGNSCRRLVEFMGLRK